MKSVVLKIKTLSASERKITAEIIDCIREIDLLKIFLEMGYPSLMEFLVRECGYSETAALRRIDAARVVNAIPEISVDLKSGSINLSQISIVAQSVRQKEKLGEKVSLETKRDLMKAVQHKRTYEVQKIAAQILDLPVLQTEKVRVQSDESVRLEISFSKEEMEILNKAKEHLGHVKPGMSTKELVVLMAERVIKTKDPAREVRMRKKTESNYGEATQKSMDRNSLERESIDRESIDRESRCQESADRDLMDWDLVVKKLSHSCSASEFNISNSRNSIENSRNTEGRSASVNLKAGRQVSAVVKRQVFQRDQGCQWVNPTTGRKCEGRHLLEVDHITPKWAGGSDELENLELKCRAHNQWKYKNEAGISIGYT